MTLDRFLFSLDLRLDDPIMASPSLSASVDSDAAESGEVARGVMGDPVVAAEMGVVESSSGAYTASGSIRKDSRLVRVIGGIDWRLIAQMSKLYKDYSYQTHLLRLFLKRSVQKYV